MSRLTAGNVLKVAVAVFFFPFLPLLILMIGVRRSNWKVLLEGGLYVGLVLAAVALPQSATQFILSFFVVMGLIAVSAMRSYMLRDLWLPPRKRGFQRYSLDQPPVPAGAEEAEGTRSAQELSSALAWSSSVATKNRHRLPPEAYASVLETCRTLDTVIDAEARDPLGDPQFEYELAATVRDYLPSVLRSYLAIPPAMLDKRQISGRTPNQELAEQLQLLSGQAEQLHASRHRRTSADLTNTGNFLRERFGYRQGGYDFGIK